MWKLSWLGWILFSAHAVAGGIHEQIDECQVTRDENCTKAILHQLARASTTTKVGSWCVCEKTGEFYANLIHVTVNPDGTKTTSPITIGMSTTTCTTQLVNHEFCKKR